MTNHKAALILKAIINETHTLPAETCEALMMAIHALEEREAYDDDGK